MKGIKLLFLMFLVGFTMGFLVNAFLPSFPSGPGEMKMVTKVIDGDTVVVEGGYHVRLLGMDADERGYPCYTPAKKKLEELVLNKKVLLEPGREDRDMYGRYLRYLFLNGTNINLEMVKQGYAVARLSEDDKYKKEIQKAEKNAMEKKLGCKWRNI